jgi:nucleotide-binding universal stress UspA family protein
MFSNILVSIDGSDPSYRALDAAIELARKFDSKLHLVHVVREMQLPTNFGRLQDYEQASRSRHDLLTAAGEHMLSQAERSCESKGIKAPEIHMGSGDPANAIIGYGTRNAVDLIVMGSRGLGQVDGFLLGSVSRKVSNTAKVPCLIIK